MNVYVRLNPYNPTIGNFLKSYTAGDGQKFVHGKWARTTMAAARKLSEVVQQHGVRGSANAFTIVRTPEDAIKLEQREQEIRRGHDEPAPQNAMSVDDLRALVHARRVGGDDDVFTDTGKAIESLDVRLAEAAEDLAPLVRPRRRRTRRRGGRGRRRRPGRIDPDAPRRADPDTEDQPSTDSPSAPPGSRESAAARAPSDGSDDADAGGSGPDARPGGQE